MIKVLKLQRVGLITPTVVEYGGKVLATNHLDIESLCNLWRVHFGFYTTEKVDLAMTKKQFSSIQQKTLSSVKSVYELFYERNFIPREFEANEEHTEWGMYRNKELEKLEAENAALRDRLKMAVTIPFDVIDMNTGKEPDEWEIANKEEWARNLCHCDMSGFAIMQDGTLIILDECGAYSYCPHGRFEIKSETRLAELKGGKEK